MRRPFFFPPLLFIPFAFLGALAVMLLWNAILPDLLHVTEIGYWQSLGLLVLARILFGGFHRGCGHHSHYGDHRWHHMTPEEREKMRVEWRMRCGWREKPETQSADNA
jgi:hypothetical protein